MTTSGVTLRLLEVFVTVAETGSMSLAAEKLDFTQPAISLAITTLEQALGVKLFDRSVRPPALTLTGNSVYDRAREIVVKTQELGEAARYGTKDQLSFLRIGILNSFAATAGPFMINLLRDITSDWTIVSGFRATQFQALIDRQVDFIITADENPVPSNVDIYPILTEPFMLALPRSYHAKVVNTATLASDLDFIRYGREAHMSQRIDDYLQAASMQPLRRYQFDTTDAAMRMVGSGLGWTITTPLVFLKSSNAAETIRVQALPGAPMSRKLVVAARRADGSEIAGKIAAAAKAALREVVLPGVATLMPEFAKKVIVPKKARG
ncbi:LysR family transcriptional regulator [Bordetella sp. BOR01]|uniref:LysR family transcriptional regulator n=1 Tax=Bordetella sp. BOR01 TaxID=2854779 RepID=UPI001C43A912|nr:LysR family transcriptional regulator [Bordetella sp. BOR01]MBV7483677.1 LysR family transcriptional regulator [Bordetella sp. BOR01]